MRTSGNTSMWCSTTWGPCLCERACGIKTLRKSKIGDIFIQGGSPGHCVMVVDVAAKAFGERIFLLAQSFMPARKSTCSKIPGPNFQSMVSCQSQGPLATPESVFR